MKSMWPVPHTVLSSLTSHCGCPARCILQYLYLKKPPLVNIPYMALQDGGYTVNGGEPG